MIAGLFWFTGYLLLKPLEVTHSHETGHITKDCSYKDLLWNKENYILINNEIILIKNENNNTNENKNENEKINDIESNNNNNIHKNININNESLKKSLLNNNNE